MPRKLRTHRSNCEHCGQEIVVTNRRKAPNRFCNQSCSNAWGHKNGLRRAYCADKSNIEQWKEKYSAEEVQRRLDSFREKMRASSRRSWSERFDKQTLERMKRLSKRSWEEVHGKERAEEMRIALKKRTAGVSFVDLMDPEARAEFLANKIGPMRGKKHAPESIQRMRDVALEAYKNGRKIDPKSGRGRAGYYKGQLFRSAYEFAYLKYLESKSIDIKRDIVYEPYRIPYCDKNDIERTYIPDFLLKDQNLLIEVKPKKRLCDENTKRKFAAAEHFCEDNNLQFSVVTEDDLGAFLCTKEELAQDPDVKLIRRRDGR